MSFMQSQRFNSALLVSRILVGVIFFAHGMMKFNMGMSAITQGFQQSGIPLALLAAWLVTLIETFGGIALIVGIATRITAALLTIIMLVATSILKFQFDLSLIETQGTGYELTLALIAALLPIMTLGGGAFSLSTFLRNRKQQVNTVIQG